MCAMLFWEWRVHKRQFNQVKKSVGKNFNNYSEIIIKNKEILFKKAYAMLKDKQC